MFRFKQFNVSQDKCAMKIGTDGVLLGAWIKIDSPNRILDIGTGTGLIALMLAQRFSKSQITALEIDPLAAEQANDNFKDSFWSNRLHATNTSLQKFSPKNMFDLIVSNPPYFENVSKAKSEERTQARHTDYLSFETLVSHSAKWLSNKGILAIIIPIASKEKIVKIANKKNLFLQRICIVKGNESSTAKRALMDFSFQKENIKKSMLVIEEKRHQYTQKYIELCKDFYLKM